MKAKVLFSLLFGIILLAVIMLFILDSDARSEMPVFRNVTEAEVAVVSRDVDDLFKADRQLDSVWMKEVLLRAKIKGWSQGGLARRLSQIEPSKIDSLLNELIKSNEGVYLPAAFHVLTIQGLVLAESAQSFRYFLDRRLIGEMPMDKEYTGVFTVAIITAVGRLARDGDEWMKVFLAKMRASGSIGKVKATKRSKDFMFHNICAFSPIIPDEATIAFLNSVRETFPYSQLEIDLINNYNTSGDSYQEYIFQIIMEGDPTFNKYIPRYVPPNNGALPPVKLHVIDRSVSNDN